MKGSSVLITGINGFLAKQVLKLLIAEGYRIVGLSNQHGVSEPQNKVIAYSTLEALFRSEMEFKYVFHLAAFIPYGVIYNPGKKLYETNIRLTSLLVEKYPSARFVFSSSVAVYGVPLSLPISLYSPYNRPDAYGLSKLAGESVIRSLDSYAIIRYSSIIGKGMKPVSFIPKIIEQAKQNGNITLLGNGTRQQNYIDVGDAAGLCLAAAKEKENMTMLGVAEKSYTNREIAKWIVEKTGAAIEYTGTDDSPSFVYDNKKEGEAFLVPSTTPIVETITQMLQ